MKAESINTMKNKILLIFAYIAALFVLLTGCVRPDTSNNISLDDIPEFSHSAYFVINNNEPYFSTDEITNVSFENYSDLDYLGRCGVASSCIGIDIMPTEERGSIGQIKPSGWQSIKYDFVDGKYLYNRCHLIGFQLAGENANEKNLITGTRYMNTIGMLPFENMVADYVKETENHVMYRVTPIFKGNELVARGVLMEAWSVEDNGEGICFNVYVYNNQPGVKINYSDGTSIPENEEFPSLTPSITPASTPTQSPVAEQQTYILNTNSHKFHKETCSLAKDIKESNRKIYTGDRDSLINDGYSPCKSCNP